MYYIGLDIHKKFTQACVLDADGRLVCNDRIRTDVHDIGHWFERMETRTNELKVVMEARGSTSGSTMPSRRGTTRSWSSIRPRPKP